MKLTKIKHLSGNKYELLIDNEKHIIYDDVLLAFNLYKKGDISKKDYDDILLLNAFYEGYYKAIKYLSFKMRSEKEVRLKLKDISIDNKNIDKIIDKLKNTGYLSNDEYIKAFINDQINLSLNGPKKIVLMLNKKGINANDINSYLDNISDDIWKKRTHKIIIKKLKVSKGSENKIKQKIKNELYNLGYLEKHFIEELENIVIDDNISYEKDKEILIKKFSKKYEKDKLDYIVKQKLYALGYRHD